MSRPTRIHRPGLIFHAMSRGNNRLPVFIDDQDRRVFLRILESVRQRNQFKLFAYCLMPNHFHLLIEVGQLDLSASMQQLLTRYSGYFNKRHARIGHLFQGRFKSVLCGKDEQLVHLLKYIHMNPVKAGLVPTPSAWRWSSARDYSGDFSICRVDWRWPLSLLHADPALARQTYHDFMGVEDDSELAQADGPVQADGPPHPQRISLDGLAGEVARETGISLAEMKSQTKRRRISAARRFLALRGIRAGFRSMEIARFLGKNPSLVSRLIEPVGPEIANRKA